MLMFLLFVDTGTLSGCLVRGGKMLQCRASAMKKSRGRGGGTPKNFFLHLAKKLCQNYLIYGVG